MRQTRDYNIKGPHGSPVRINLSFVSRQQEIWVNLPTKKLLMWLYSSQQQPCNSSFTVVAEIGVKRNNNGESITTDLADIISPP